PSCSSLVTRPPPRSTLFPYTTLFRSEEHEVTHLTDPRIAVPGGGATVGPFTMRFFHVTHSIPDGMAVAIDTPYGSVLHTGDFKRSEEHTSELQSVSTSYAVFCVKKQS